jgi:hypothetical protein
MRTYDKLIATIQAAKAGGGLRARFGVWCRPASGALRKP